MPRKSRIRRTAEDARALILDAAEAQLRERGPDGLRLKDLAREVGVSHPAILHHFGSRTGLVQAVIARTTERMQAQIMAALARDFDPVAGATLLDRVFRVLGDRGIARTLAWLCLASETPPADLMATHVRTLAEAVHRVRCERHPDAEASFEDTLFTVTLAAMAPIGNAIAGEALRASAGQGDDPDAERRFVVWFAALVRRHLESGGGC
jgi:TetR/AcrR family transcriptional regulator, repressor for neighboring sulfatase